MPGCTRRRSRGSPMSAGASASGRTSSSGDFRNFCQVVGRLTSYLSFRGRDDASASAVASAVRARHSAGRRGRVEFYGWRVVAAAFVLAFFGWGLGFYGPPVYLHAIREARGFSLAVVSTAVTVHYLTGAFVAANVPALYRRFGLPATTVAAAILLATGICGWGPAREPWQLFFATLVSGAGWAAMGGVAVNAVISPWFVRTRPAALGTAYNGASFAGLIFSPLWVFAIAAMGFPAAAAVVGLAAIITVWVLAAKFFARTPQPMGLAPDGDAPGAAAVSITSTRAKPLPGPLLWRDFNFITLAAGSALSLFAQIGLITHLY